MKNIELFTLTKFVLEPLASPSILTISALLFFDNHNSYPTWGVFIAENIT